MILIFDVETNGLATRKESELNKIESPRLLEIAWRLYDYDKTLQEEKHFFVYHDNLEVTSECFNINGISQEYLQNYGTDLKSILIEFKNVLSRSNILVGHNLEFDISVIQGEFSRQNMMLLLDSKQRICTMKSSTEYCGISSNWGLKYPTLAELFTFIFNELPLNEHSAFNDVKTTSRCFWHLSDNRIVNYFANQPLYQPDKSIRSWSYEPDSFMEIKNEFGTTKFVVLNQDYGQLIIPIHSKYTDYKDINNVNSWKVQTYVSMTNHLSNFKRFIHAMEQIHFALPKL